MFFNYIDIILFLLILLNIWCGWHRGFLLGVIDLTRWVGSFLAALFFYQPVSRFLGFVTGWSEVWTQPTAFILIVIFANFLLQMLGNIILRQIPKQAHKHQTNRIFGILSGLTNGLIIASIVSALLFSLPISDDFQESLRASRTADRFAEYTNVLEEKLTPIFAEPIRRTLNRRMTIEPGSKETVRLNYKTEKFRPRPDLETQMLEIVNAERVAHGLAPLAPDPEMTEVARKHSADMFTRGYFSHYTPEGKDPFDRMRENNVGFRTAGENLALAPTLQIAHEGLMNSPGHRENILRPQFGRLGIGILDGGRYGLMITQNFRN
jgi:Uncharacterized protein with SCP/PR1 domains